MNKLLLDALLSKFPFDISSAESTESTMALLHGLVRFTRPERVLEIGTCTGCSTTWMLAALLENRKGHITSVELRVSLHKTATENLGRIFTPSELQLCTLIQGDFFDQRFPEPFNFVFIDLDPKTRYIDAFSATPLAPGALVCAHDLTFKGDRGACAGVEALRDHLASLSFQILELPQERGMLLARKP